MSFVYNVYSTDAKNVKFRDFENPYTLYAFLDMKPMDMIKWLTKRIMAKRMKRMKCPKCGETCTLGHQLRNIEKRAWRCKRKPETTMRKYSLQIFPTGSH